MKKITILTLLMTLALSASAISLPDSLNYTVRLGYNIGGTAPIGCLLYTSDAADE